MSAAIRGIETPHQAFVRKPPGEETVVTDEESREVYDAQKS
jgi:hypothetical protein